MNLRWKKFSALRLLPIKLNRSSVSIICIVFWTMLNLVMPQVSTSEFTTGISGWRALYPFANWHLFSSSTRGASTFRLIVYGCPGELKEATPFNLNQNRHLNPVAGIKWRINARIQYISRLFEMGEIELARKSMNWLVASSFPQFANCHLTLVKPHVEDPLRYSFVEGSRRGN